jgi:hypothetical protein
VSLRRTLKKRLRSRRALTYGSPFLPKSCFFFPLTDAWMNALTRAPMAIFDLLPSSPDLAPTIPASIISTLPNFHALSLASELPRPVRRSVTGRDVVWTNGNPRHVGCVSVSNDGFRVRSLLLTVSSNPRYSLQCPKDDIPAFATLSPGCGDRSLHNTLFQF